MGRKKLSKEIDVTKLPGIRPDSLAPFSSFHNVFKFSSDRQWYEKKIAEGKYSWKQFLIDLNRRFVKLLPNPDENMTNHEIKQWQMVCHDLDHLSLRLYYLLLDTNITKESARNVVSVFDQIIHILSQFYFIGLTKSVKIPNYINPKTKNKALLERAFNIYKKRPGNRYIQALKDANSELRQHKHPDAVDPADISSNNSLYRRFLRYIEKQKHLD